MTMLAFSTDVERHAINRVASSPAHTVRKVLKPEAANLRLRKCRHLAPLPMNLH